MGMFDLTMTDEQVAEYREMVAGWRQARWRADRGRSAFRRGGYAAKMGISKARSAASPTPAPR